MKIVSIGGGPGGLYFSILMKKADPRHDVTVLERNGPDDTFGWGVVFSDETLRGLADADRESWDVLASRFARWDDIDVHVGGRVVRSGGHGFAGLSRKALLNVLQARAAELGVRIEYHREVEDWRDHAAADLVLAADGVNSKTRAALADVFQPTIVRGSARYMWLGTPLKLSAFTFFVRENEHGLFCVHAYPFDAGTSTFIVETDEETWRNAGLDAKDTEAAIAYLQGVFAKELGGAPLLSNRSAWIQFPTITNARWSHQNVVLAGDAVHTAHFSIGSGTKLAMEDAVELAAALRGARDVASGLAAYEETRRPQVERLQAVARRSQAWFEDIKRYRRLPPERFTFSLLTRSYKVSWRNLAKRDPAYVDGLREWHAREQGFAGEGPAPPPMLLPARLRGLEVPNRIVVSPMCMYSAVDGMPNDWHLVHLGSRAIGGAGIVLSEMTDVEPEGRISPGCAGLWSDAHAEAWRRVTDFVHAHSKAAIGIQLAHAGRKASCAVPWGGEKPSWSIVGPSALPFAPGDVVPREMTREDMDRVKAAFVSATRRADAAGFDLVEVHGAHGYLLSSFLSPLSNRRDDEYGGRLENRMRWPLEVFAAMRAAWPAAKPMGMRLSASDWIPGGFTPEEAVVVARALKELGCDFVDVSSGGNAPEGRPPYYGRMYQTPFADRVRQEADLPVMSVGAITDWDQANTILAAGRADFVVLAREHLRDPYFTLHAAEEQGVTLPVPPQYLALRSLPSRKV